MNLFIAKVVWTFDPTSSHRNPDEVGEIFHAVANGFFHHNSYFPPRLLGAWLERCLEYTRLGP